MKCLYRDVDCDKVTHKPEMGMTTNFCICCLTGKLIDELKHLRKGAEDT